MQNPGLGLVQPPAPEQIKPRQNYNRFSKKFDMRDYKLTGKQLRRKKIKEKRLAKAELCTFQCPKCKRMVEGLEVMTGLCAGCC